MLTETDADFRFLMDGQTVVIDDYLAIRPEARPRLDRAVREGRIEVGPWYTLPDEFLVSGENLVRNLQRGLASAASHGASLRAGYLPDSFGHAAQMPQIYRQFGFGHAVVWRGVPLAIDRLAFCWESPDGSEILTAYMGNSYSHGVDLPTEAAALALRIEAAVKAMAPFRPAPDVLLMNGNDHVLPQRKLTAAIRAANDRPGPMRIRLSGLGQYLATLTGDDWPRWSGELRSSARANVLMGTLSVRIPDKQHYFEAAQAVERMAEPLAALSGVDAIGLLDQAWTLLLQNAAHDTVCGSGIDAVAEEARLRSESAHQIAVAVAARCLPRLAGDGQVWNPSAFPRRGLVEVELEGTPAGAQVIGEEVATEPVHFRFPAAEVGRVHAVLDERRIASEVIATVHAVRRGKTVRVTVETESVGPGHDLAEARLTVERLANEPGVDTIEVEVHRRPRRRVLLETPVLDGSSVASLKPSRREPEPAPARADGTTIENGHLRCSLTGLGTLVVEHNATGLAYHGLNSLIDEGDAGDEYTFSPPGADRERGRIQGVAGPAVRETGPLRASLETRFQYWVPAGLGADRQHPAATEVPLEVRVAISLERDVPRLDITMEVVNLAMDHRLRARFPTPFPITHSDADTAFHVTRRPAIRPRQDPGAPELELPTYPLRSFVDVSGEAGGMALITQGLHEYEVLPGPPPELALTLLRSVGWLSRDDLRFRTGHAGPPMETPGAQVPGPHRFRYSLLFHEGDWEQGGVWRATECALLPMQVGRGEPVVGAAPVIEIEPACIQMTACVPRPDGYELRLVNASGQAHDALVRISPAPAEVRRVTLGGDFQTSFAHKGGLIRLPLRRWEIATLKVQRSRPDLSGN